MVVTGAVGMAEPFSVAQSCSCCHTSCSAVWISLLRVYDTMKNFQFSLDRVLKVRELQLGIEKARYEQQAARVWALEEERAALEAHRDVPISERWWAQSIHDLHG